VVKRLRGEPGHTRDGTAAGKETARQRYAHINAGHVPDFIRFGVKPMVKPQCYELKCYTPFHVSTPALGLGSTDKGGAASTADGGRFAMGNTEEALIVAVVRQGLTRRIYGAADAGLVISFATYPFAVPAEEGGGFMQLRWFQVRSTDDPGCVSRRTSSQSSIQTHQHSTRTTARRPTETAADSTAAAPEPTAPRGRLSFYRTVFTGPLYKTVLVPVKRHRGCGG
jgi:hypothetical protein